MDTSPEVSIITPFVRGGRWLEEAINSVYAQTWNSWELLLVDNGAPAAALDGIELDGRAVLLHEDNRGTAWARSRGLGRARGRFVALLDEDDRWHNRKLELQLRAIEGSGAPFCHSAYEVIDEAGERIDSSHLLVRTYEDLLSRRAGILPSTSLISRDALLSAGGFDVTYDRSEDFPLFLSLLSLGDAIVIDTELASYRRHGSSVSSQYTKQCSATMRTFRTVRRKAVRDRRWDRVGLSIRGELASRKGFGEVAFHRAGSAMVAGRRSESLAHVLTGLRLNPLGVHSALEGWRQGNGREDGEGSSQAVGT